MTFDLPGRWSEQSVDEAEASDGRVRVPKRLAEGWSASCRSARHSDCQAVEGLHYDLALKICERDQLPYRLIGRLACHAFGPWSFPWQT